MYPPPISKLISSWRDIRNNNIGQHWFSIVGFSMYSYASPIFFVEPLFLTPQPACRGNYRLCACDLHSCQGNSKRFEETCKHPLNKLRKLTKTHQSQWWFNPTRKRSDEQNMLIFYSVDFRIQASECGARSNFVQRTRILYKSNVQASSLQVPKFRKTYLDFYVLMWLMEMHSPGYMPLSFAVWTWQASFFPFLLLKTLTNETWSPPPAGKQTASTQAATIIGKEICTRAPRVV